MSCILHNSSQISLQVEIDCIMDVENNVLSNNENLGLRLDVFEETPLCKFIELLLMLPHLEISAGNGRVTNLEFFPIIINF